MKRMKADGTGMYYCYYKKKRGRKKKPGPKPKRVIKGHPHWDFKIVGCDRKKQVKYIGIYHNAEEAEYMKSILEKENSEVIFPVKYINNGRNFKAIADTKSEYLILQRVKSGGTTDTVTQLRNDFGKLVDHKVSNNKWLIYDKFPWLKEETFWAYGYNPKFDRKTFKWIYENFITAYLEEDYNIVRILLYNNKVVFKYDNEDFNFVICKNTSDAIRMYNLINDWSIKNKQVLLAGSVTDYQKYKLIREIQEKTGWTLNKIRKTETRT